MLINDTVNKQKNIISRQKRVKNINWYETDQSAILIQSMEELSLGSQKTNPSSGREGDSNLGLPDYKTST